MPSLTSRIPFPIRRFYRTYIRPLVNPRQRLAHTYLRGDGLEIGALNAPVSLSRAARVRNVDFRTKEEARIKFPELAGVPIADVHIIDNGETLATIHDDSADFLVANHMLEHCKDTIGTIKNHLRVVRSGGVLYYAVPDKRYTFDVGRPVTTLDHHIRDYKEGPGWSQRAHYEDWLRHVGHLADADIPARVEKYVEEDFDIHFHVWTGTEFLELLVWCSRNLAPGFDIEAFEKNGNEVIAILRKSGAPTASEDQPT